MVHKKRGRPRCFDRDTALAAAMEVFWAKGFDGASLDDLTTAMGINRPSLYGAFGDKRALFRAALAYYGGGIGGEPVTAFDRGATPEAAVRGFLVTAVENNTRGESLPQGCLFASCAATVAGDAPEVRAMLGTSLEAMENHLTAGLERFRASGALPEAYPAEARARLMMDTMQGQAYRARAGESREKLLADLPDRVNAILPQGGGPNRGSTTPP